MTTWNAFDEAVHSEPAQVVRHLAGSIVVERSAEELCHSAADIAMAEAARVEGKQTEHLQEGEHAAIAEVQGRAPSEPSSRSRTWARVAGRSPRPRPDRAGRDAAVRAPELVGPGVPSPNVEQ